jgi:hypothetical protein
MLRKLSPVVNECLHRAAECDVKVQNAADPEVRRNFAFLADQWRRLADSHAYIERSQDFLGKR